MSQDTPFRFSFDRLAEQAMAAVSSELKKLGDEAEQHTRQLLTASELKLQEAEQAAEVAQGAAREAQQAAQEVTRRHEDALNAVNARAREEVAVAEDRAREALDRAEAVAREAIADAEARAKEAVAAAQAEAKEMIAAAETRSADAVALAEARSEEAIAQAQEEGRAAVAAADQKIQEHTVANESRGRTALETALARARAEAKADLLNASERLVTAVRAFDAGQSLSEVMNALVRSACLETERVGIFVREGTQLRSWKLIGFDHVQGETGLSLSLDEAGIVGDALQSGQVTLAGPSTSLPAPAFAGLPDDHVALAVPLVISREVIGVLYADPGPKDRGERPSWAPTIEVLGRHATRALEVLTASKLLAQALGSRAAAQPAQTAPRSPGVAAR